MNNPKNFLSRLLLLALIAIGTFLRTFSLEKLASFDFDQEVAAWWVKSLLIDHKLSLLGPEISLGGIHVGPAYYFLLSLFYFLFHLDPVAGNFLQIVFAILSMILIFRLGGKLGLFLYVFSSRLIEVDRGSNAASPLIFLALLTIALTKKPFSYLVTSGLGWNFHPTAILFIPIGLLQSIKERTFKLKNFLIGLGLFILLVSPTLIFELRHGFVNSQNLLRLTSGNFSNYSYPFIFKTLVSLKILVEIFLSILAVPINSVTIAITIVVFIIWKKPWKKYVVWILPVVTVVSLYNQNTPEYYFLILFPIIVLIIVDYLRLPLSSKYGHAIFASILLLFLFLNFNKIISFENPLSLFYKKQAVQYIIANSHSNNPRVEIITDPGQNSGFNYLSWLAGKPFQSGEVNPEFKIIIPKSLSPKMGPSFGAIKVITVSE